jgi:hypothetical protein
VFGFVFHNNRRSFSLSVGAGVFGSLTRISTKSRMTAPAGRGK